MYFCYFVIISLGKWCGPLFEQTWILFIQGCFVPSLGWNWPCCSWKKKFNFVNLFSLFRNYLLLEKDVALYLKKLESLFPSLVEIGYVVFEKKMQMWKVSNGWTDGRRTTGDKKSLLESSSELKPIQSYDYILPSINEDIFYKYILETITWIF